MPAVPPCWNSQSTLTVLGSGNCVPGGPKFPVFPSGKSSSRKPPTYASLGDTGTGIKVFPAGWLHVALRLHVFECPPTGGVPLRHTPGTSSERPPGDRRKTRPRSSLTITRDLLRISAPLRTAARRCDSAVKRRPGSRVPRGKQTEWAFQRHGRELE